MLYKAKLLISILIFILVLLLLCLLLYILNLLNNLIKRGLYIDTLLLYSLYNYLNYLLITKAILNPSYYNSLVLLEDSRRDYNTVE